MVQGWLSSATAVDAKMPRVMLMRRRRRRALGTTDPGIIILEPDLFT